MSRPIKCSNTVELDMLALTMQTIFKRVIYQGHNIIRKVLLVPFKFNIQIEK